MHSEVDTELTSEQERLVIKASHRLATLASYNLLIFFVTGCWFMANWNAINVNIDAADIPIWVPDWEGSIQNTVQDMKTISVSGKITFQM